MDFGHSPEQKPGTIMITISVARISNGYSININGLVVLKEEPGLSLGAKPFDAELDLNATESEALVFSDQNFATTLSRILSLCNTHHINHQITTIPSTKITQNLQRYVLHEPLDLASMKKILTVIEDQRTKY